jgi:hypothetical protein
MTAGSRQQHRGVSWVSAHASWLAWSLWAVCVALIALALLLDVLSADAPVRPQERLGPGLAVLTGVLALVYPTVGALIASRLPNNPIGWIFCSVGLLYTAQRFSKAYADYALLENLAFPGGEYMAWFSSLVEFSGLTLAGVFVMLLFPDGRLLTRRWKIVAWTAVLAAVLTAQYSAFYPEFLGTHSYVMNPFGVVGYIGPFTTYEIFIALALVGEVLFLMISIAALLSLALRLHRARGDERQQLKWFLYAAVPAGLSFIFVLLSFIVVDYTELVFLTPFIPFWGIYYDVFYVAVFALLVVPVFTYIAILRYRLYDIDVVINRTLVYGALTALLAAIYFGSVTATQAIFRTLTGQEQQPQLAIVVSTLVIAALFSPLRRRIQGFIDRRFYRRKYDAAKTLAAFSAKLRDETDLDTLSDDLVGVVRETMQPAHVSLWLRPELPPKGNEGPE